MTNLLFIGELDIHERDFLPFLAGHGYNVTVINTACPYFPRTITGTEIPVFNLYEKRRIRFAFKGSVGRAYILKAASGGTLERVGFRFEEIIEAIKKRRIDLIYGSWGSIGLPELRFVRKLNVPLIYEFLTYPVGFTKTVEKIENLLNKSIIDSLTGRVFASSSMRDYMERNFDLKSGHSTIFTESYSERCFYQKRLPRLSDNDHEPHLVFLGFDSSEIFPQIEEMLRRKIHVHVCETLGFEDRLRKSRHKTLCHVFKKTSGEALFNGSFANFLTQYDACLVTYNIDRATSARLCNSLPNRFSYALTAGIPFVMPKGYLKSCESIVSNKQIGFAYATYDELKDRLYDRSLMDSYQNNAVKQSSAFTLERNFGKIDHFLRRVIDTK